MAAGGLAPDIMLLALSRALAVATLFTAFGTLLVRRCIATAPADRAARWLRRLQGLALSAAAAATLAWAVLEAGVMGESPGPAEAIAVLPEMLADTVFGHMLLARLALLALTAALLVAARGRAAGLALVPAGLAVVLQVAALHGYAMHQGPSLLLVAEALHVLAAAAWLGALPALAVIAAASPAKVAGQAAHRFSALGIAAVVTLAATAGVQARALVGTWAGLFDSAYGRVALAKLLLFALLVAFAARNRLRLVPLTAAGDAAAHARLRRSIAAAAVLGLVVIALASLLSTMAPAIDLETAG